MKTISPPNGCVFSKSEKAYHRALITIKLFAQHIDIRFRLTKEIRSTTATIEIKICCLIRFFHFSMKFPSHLCRSFQHQTHISAGNSYLCTLIDFNRQSNPPTLPVYTDNCSIKNISIIAPSDKLLDKPKIEFVRGDPGKRISKRTIRPTGRYKISI